MTPDLSPLAEVALEASSPREMRLAAARGILPIDPVELVEVQRRLSADVDPDLASAAREGFAATESAILVGWVGSYGSEEALDSAAFLSDSPAFVEAILRSRAVADETLVRLARALPPDLQDVLVVNQARLIRAPRILEALGSNSRLSGDVRRRLHEIDEEFFRKRAPEREAAAEQPSAVEASAERAEAAAGPSDALFDDIELDEELVSDFDGELTTSTRESIFQKIQQLTVSQKIALGRKGNKEARTILIREMNRLVATATISSPRMTPNEVEAIASMRNVHEDVLRFIATNRDWSRRYAVMLNLVKNPRAPAEFSMQFVPRLSQRDMKALSIDKGVSEQVRAAARRIYQQKYQK